MRKEKVFDALIEEANFIVRCNEAGFPTAPLDVFLSLRSVASYVFGVLSVESSILNGYVQASINNNFVGAMPLLPRCGGQQ